MRADDEGFVNNPKKIQRMVGAADDDMKILIAKRYVLVFESGVLVIKHWKIHNYIQNDRFKPTLYKEERALIEVKENNSYTEVNRIQSGYNLDAQESLGESSIGKGSQGKSDRAPRFSPPSLDEVSAYCTERGNNVDADTFINFYTSNGWLVGKNKMKDWKACVRTWEKRDSGRPAKQGKGYYNPFPDLAKQYEESGE
jgi:hypothetical protein